MHSWTITYMDGSVDTVQCQHILPLPSGGVMFGTQLNAQQFDATFVLPPNSFKKIALSPIHAAKVIPHG